MEDKEGGNRRAEGRKVYCLKHDKRAVSAEACIGYVPLLNVLSNIFRLSFHPGFIPLPHAIPEFSRQFLCFHSRCR